MFESKGQPSPQTGQGAVEEALLDVLSGELKRSMTGLSVPGSPRVYAMTYALRRRQDLLVRSAYGSLTRAREAKRSTMFVDVRVGTHAFDNFVDGGLEVDAEDRESADWIDAPDDLDPGALRVALWKLTQIKFDEAQQDYFDHRKAMVSEFLRDEVDAFGPARACVHVEPVSTEPFPRAEWESILQRVSQRFLEHPEVYDPYVELRASRLHRWIVNDEGTRVLTEDLYLEFSVAGWVLTDDGVYVEASRQVYARALEELPDEAGMNALLDEVLADLRELQNAPSPGSFIGPALLAGQAAATMFHEALGHRLEGERLVARGETRTFADRVGDRILPEGLSVYDDPTLTHAGDTVLWGHYRIDDQGVPSQRVKLVDDGILAAFLQSRAPTPHGRNTNGHGRHDGLQPVMARMGNLLIEGDPKAARTWDELLTQLRDLAKAQGRKYAAVIHRIHAGETSTSSYDFQVFKGELSDVRLLNAETGEMHRIRDMELIGTPLSAMQRVLGFGGEPGVDHGFCYAESGSVPVSGVAPALLLGEVELQQRSVTGFHEPLLPPPFADDGSRGRTGGDRKRGRRKRRGEPT